MITLHDPWLATQGGGERYFTAFADAVEVPGPRRLIVADRADTAVAFIPRHDEVRVRSARHAVVDTLGASLSLTVATRMIPPSAARRAITIVQFPFRPLHAGHRLATLLGRRRSVLVTYSAFAQRWIEERFALPSHVIAPAIDLPAAPADARRGPVIVSVGRFFPGEHCKRHDVLIRAFADLRRADPTTDWSLHLVGGIDRTDPASMRYLEDLRLAAVPGVTFEIDAPEARKADLLARARFLWQATGFGRAADEPEAAEHFGIAAVEAIGAGCLPLLFADGGHVEVVDGDEDHLWRTPDDLVRQTLRWSTAGSGQRAGVAERRLASARRRFGSDTFRRSVASFVDEVMEP